MRKFGVPFMPLDPEKARYYAHHQKFKYCVLDFSASLEAWRSDGKRGVWVKIPLTQAELVPIAAKVSPKKKRLLFGVL